MWQSLFFLIGDHLCVHAMPFRATRDWGSALQEAQTTPTLVKTPASSSLKSSPGEQLPRTAGSGQTAHCQAGPGGRRLSRRVVPEAEAHHQGRGGSSMCSAQRHMKQQEESLLRTISRSCPPLFDACGLESSAAYLGI